MAIIVSVVGLFLIFVISGGPKKVASKLKKKNNLVISGEDFVAYSYVNNVDRLFCSVDDIQKYGEVKVHDIILKRKILTAVSGIVIAVVVAVLSSTIFGPALGAGIILLILGSSILAEKQMIAEKEDKFERTVVEIYPLFFSSQVHCGVIFNRMISDYMKKVGAPSSQAALYSMKKLNVGKNLLSAFEKWNADSANKQLREATSSLAEIIIENRASRRVEKAAAIEQKIAAPATLYIFSVMLVVIVVPVVIRAMSLFGRG